MTLILPLQPTKEETVEGKQFSLSSPTVDSSPWEEMAHNCPVRTTPSRPLPFPQPSRSAVLSTQMKKQVLNFNVTRRAWSPRRHSPEFKLKEVMGRLLWTPA